MINQLFVNVFNLHQLFQGIKKSYEAMLRSSNLYHVVLEEIKIENIYYFQPWTYTFWGFLQ